MKELNKRQILHEDFFFMESSKVPLNQTITYNAETGTILLKGVIQRANAKNKNKRVYRREILQKQMQIYSTKIKNRGAYGELDHPDCNEVQLKFASHILIDYYWDGDDVIGTIQVLDGTEMGEILKSLVRKRTSIGISSRGIGSIIVRDGYDEVDDDFEIISFDIVADPSTHGAIMKPLAPQPIKFQSVDNKEQNPVVQNNSIETVQETKENINQNNNIIKKQNKTTKIIDLSKQILSMLK